MPMLDLTQLHIMGILNVTPDSFSDGGKHNTIDTALYHAEKMLNEGASIIDIGGESTRPNAPDVALNEELDRVIPVVEKLKAEFDVVISVDTSKAAVMKAAIQLGADMINDVRALQGEGALQACADSDVPICLMHMQGQPRTMQTKPEYQDVITDIKAFFQQRIVDCEQAGIERNRLILDPGFGFGKTLDHNVALLAGLEQFADLGLPLLVGISRKTMIGALLDDAPVDQRLYGSVSAAVIAAMKGANILRVHDVKATADAIKIVQAVRQNNVQ